MHAKKDSSLSLLVYIYKNPLYSLCFLLPSDIVHISRVYVLFIVLVEGYGTEKREYQKKNPKRIYIPVLWCIKSLISS